MSRIGNKIIRIPPNVQYTYNNRVFAVKGPKGELSVVIPKELELEINGNDIAVKRNSEAKPFKMIHGTIRSLIDGIIVGVTEGFEKQLEMRGVGYRAELKNDKLNLYVGHVSPIEVPIPTSIKVTMPNQTTIIVSGIDKQKVGAFAGSIRAIKPPEPYKGKGIRYVNEVVKKKVVKTAGEKK